MANTGKQPFGPNRAPLLTGVSAVDNVTPTPVSVNPATGALLVSSSGGISTVGVFYAGQQTVTTTAAALPSQALTQNVTVEALSSNTASVFVGPSGVTISTGIELPPGAAIALPVNNTNLVSVVTGTTGQTVTYAGA